MTTPPDPHAAATITDKASAMRALNAALTRTGLSSIDGFYDPLTGTPTPEPAPGAIEHLTRDVINTVFNDEGTDQGCAAAMERTYSWLHSMASELQDIAEHLGRLPTSPDHS